MNRLSTRLSPRPRAVVATGALICALALAACGGNTESTESTDTAAPTETTDTTATAAAQATDVPQPRATGADSAESALWVKPGGTGAAADRKPQGAGRAMPAHAQPAQVVKPYLNGIAVLTTPSGNISCGIYAPTTIHPEGGVRCGIESYNTDRPYGKAEHGGIINSVSITPGESSMFSASDVAPYMPLAHGPEDTLRPQVLNYGEALYHGSFVCLSEKKGLTCWDSVTGAGAFMSRERTDLF